MRFALALRGRCPDESPAQSGALHFRFRGMATPRPGFDSVLRLIPGPQHPPGPAPLQLGGFTGGRGQR